MELLTWIFNLAQNREETPDDWNMELIMPIFEKRDTTVCGNYRGIILISLLAEVYERKEVKLKKQN